MLTGDGELGFDCGEKVRETAVTSKTGSSRANCPLRKKARVRGSDEKYRWRVLTGAVNRNENSPESWSAVSDGALRGAASGVFRVSIGRQASYQQPRQLRWMEKDKAVGIDELPVKV